MPSDKQQDQAQPTEEQKLDLNKETLQDLNADANEDVKGGMRAVTGGCGDYPQSAYSCACA